MPKLKAGWKRFLLGVYNLRDEVAVLCVTLGAVMFTRLWPALLALWQSTPFREAPWPLLTTFIPGVFFSGVIVALDAARGTKEQRKGTLAPRLISLILQGLGVNNLIDQIQRLIGGQP